MEINVLSLFDGISCGAVALERAGFEIKNYYAYEIERNAIKISEKNYPDIQHLGDVTKEDFTKYKGKIDILIGGSPCQNLCSAGDRTGLEGIESRLFYDYVRALYEAEPKWFLLENNATMTKENQDIITEIMGVEPVYINSNLLSAQDRKRLYWTNIPGIEEPKDKEIYLKDILQPTEEKQDFECFRRMEAKKPGTLAHKKAWSQIRTIDQKARALTTSQAISNSGATNVKYADDEYYILTPLECERLQTLPDNYTEGVSNTQRYKAVGNGWTVDVIAYIFSYLRKAIEEGIPPVELMKRERPEQSYFKECSRPIKEITTRKGETMEEAAVTKEAGAENKVEVNEEDTLSLKVLKELIKEKDRQIDQLKERLKVSEAVAKQIEELKNQVFTGVMGILFAGRQDTK